MENLFSKKLTFIEFLKFVSPAIVSMVFISLYTIIDGIFVSIFVGSDALASINIVLPIISIVFAIAVMFGTGGSAIIAQKLGQGKLEDANKSFSFLSFSALILGLITGIVMFLFIEDISISLGATDKLIDYCISYGRIIALFTPVFILKSLAEYYIRTDGDFKFSLYISIIGGVINIVFDYVFIKILGLGIAGAALATVLGVLISLIFGVWYFLSSKSTLKFTKIVVDFKLLLNTLINGSSEMVTELSTGITTLLFNMLALKYAGENGVAALTIILYAHFLLVSTYLGFASGISPLISYNYGANNSDKLKETYKYSEIFILVSSIIIFLVSIVFSKNIVGVFVKPGDPVFDLALGGLKIFSVAFLFVGVNIFASGLFTAFSNGKISSLISAARAFIFVILGCIVLPPLFDINGLWLVVPFAELTTILVSIFFLKKYKKIYAF
ncbi:multidrug efflux MATE transporter CdeA [Clostridium sardiniense]|uniref:MATE family efflux transporter n=1 Tax=Clostridium sardiniense TaxID=29369 RepID=UPI00195EE705|nr:MATE family efflux transporter [Clostridium sardiniense]MBM7835990.1 putative MATE family efflux protein [Clostridium sardiniense]